MNDNNWLHDKKLYIQHKYASKLPYTNRMYSPLIVALPLRLKEYQTIQLPPKWVTYSLLLS